METSAVDVTAISEAPAPVPVAPEPAPIVHVPASSAPVPESWAKKAEDKIESVMDAIGRDSKKVLTEVVKYLPTSASLAGIIFPAKIATIQGVVSVTGLIQSTVATIEQKWAAAGAATGSGSQKLSDVLTIVEPVVISALEHEGVKADSAYVTQIVNAVVAILNVQTSTVVQS
jgi:hypothetical protein